MDEDSTEKNEDWWYGKVRGRSGLFPRAYVERIEHAVPPPPPPMIRKSSRPGSEVSAVAPSYIPYRSTHAAMAHPPDGGPNALGLHAPKADEARKGKYDHLKSTVRSPLFSRSIYPTSIIAFFICHSPNHNPRSILLLSVSVSAASMRSVHTTHVPVCVPTLQMATSAAGGVGFGAGKWSHHLISPLSER